MMMEEEYQSCWNMLALWQGGWMSVNGNPDVFIFQGYDSNYYLLAYSYDKEYGRGSFSYYEIVVDKEMYYIRMGMKSHRMESKESPSTLHIAGWGGYMKN
ncbi:hypothetical protein AGMMS49574_18270 [Bacteroidia bacterium]|nr:hypothetical protein AGMMS49574_18270 [Bacteroidia bacterium]GHU57091.1 hypothetical protein FACS189411_09640 [Bacteroidia bacterium]